MLLTAVHCLPVGMDENKRNCMVRFSRLMDRDEVLQKEIALKSGSGYSVVPDLYWEASYLARKETYHQKKKRRAQRISIFSLIKNHISFTSRILSNEKFFTIFIEKTIRSNLLTCILLYYPPSISLGIYNDYNHTHARVVTHSSNSRQIWQQVPCVS
jgi:hypothetical protein